MSDVHFLSLKRKVVVAFTLHPHVAQKTITKGLCSLIRLATFYKIVNHIIFVLVIVISVTALVLASILVRVLVLVFSSTILVALMVFITSLFIVFSPLKCLASQWKPIILSYDAFPTTFEIESSSHLTSLLKLRDRIRASVPYTF